jgi:Bacterial Ig-like domain (group 2).
MKKSFFKKLSFVLALAMIVSTIAPAAGVFAASKQALNSTKKYLYLGENGKNAYDFNIKNAVKGSSYKWTSSDAKVAKVNSKTGLATAVGTGTAKVTVKITKKGAKAVSLTASVIVKDNIKTIAIANKPDKAVTVGTDYALNTTVKTQSGASASKTAKVVFVVDSDKATVSDKGVFNAKEVGTYKVAAVAFQSNAKYLEWAALKDLTSTKNVLAYDYATIKVVNSMTSVKQKTASKADVVFAAAAKKDDVKANLNIAALSGTTKVKQTIKDVTMSTDGKTATVEIYGTFSSSVVYTFDYPDMATVQFTGATANLADVVDMQITTSTIVINKYGVDDANVNIALLNKDGVDIGSIDTNLRARITSECKSDKSAVNFDQSVIPNRLTFYVAGDTATITATFHTNDWKDGVEKGAITRTAVITGVNASANPVNSIVKWSLNKSGSGNIPNPNFTDVNQNIGVDDDYILYVKAAKQDGTSFVNNLAPSTENKGWKFETSDKSVLLVNDEVVNQTAHVYGVKQGAASVVVKYCEDTTVANPVWTVVGAIPVTVGAKRILTNVTFGTYNVTLSNTAATTKKISIDAIDQFGSSLLSNASVVASVKSNSYATPVTDSNVTVASDKKSFTVDVAGKTAGTYFVDVKVTVNSTTLTRTLTVTVQAPTAGQTVPTRYALATNDTTFDAKVAADKTSVVNTIQVVGVASNGVVMSNVAPGSAGYEIEITDPDGKTYTMTGANANYKLVSGTGSLDGVTDNFADFLVASVSGGSQFVQAKEGTYMIHLYVTQSGNRRHADQLPFTVKNTQANGTVAVSKLEQSSTSSTTGASLLVAAIKDCVKVYDGNGNEVTNNIYVNADDYSGNANLPGSTVWVKKVRYDETIAGYTLSHEVVLERQITIKK